MSDAKEVEFSLEVMLNKDETKVLFAQVDSDFADVLLSFLTLPLGTIVKLLKKHYGDEVPFFGSLNTLYNSVENLDTSHFWTDGGKQMLLNPRNSFEAECRKLKLNLDKTEPVNYFTCPDYWNCSYSINDSPEISMYYGTAKCRCGKMKNRQLTFFESNTKGTNGDSDGVFTIKTASFLLRDDLKMVPMVNGSIIQTLNNLGITDTVGTKQKTVPFGLSEIMDLLRGSLLSQTPLTDLILHTSQIGGPSIAVKFEPGKFLHQIKKEASSSNCEKKVILKVMVQKSANKILFAHAEEDFIDFLFSLLTIPLGGVEFLLDSNTCLKNIDNLYRSIANMYDSGENLNRYLKSTDQVTGNSLVKPQLPPKYLSKNQFLLLTEQNTAQLYYIHADQAYISYKMNARHRCKNASIIDPKGQGSYVMGPRVYMVSDDLTVLPLSMSSTFSILNSMNVPLSDVEEVAINIGVEEGLSILKASLTSTCALTNGLAYILRKQPKQERCSIIL